MRTRASLLSVAVFILFVCWGLITPVGSSPDDDYHLASIWCAGGLVENFCEPSPDDPDELLVPEGLAAGHACYAFRTDRDASCADDLTSSLVSVKHVNQKKGLYPGVFYGVMGLFAGSDVDSSVLVMRVVNSALAALLLFGALVLVPRGVGRALVISTTIVYVPLGLFIVPSTNPSSWALTGLATFWAFSIALLTRTSWRSPRAWIIAGGAVVGAGMAAGSRLDAAVYLSVVVVVASIVVGRQQLQRAWRAGVLLATLAILGLFVYWTTQPTVTQGRGPTSDSDPGLGFLIENALEVPKYIWDVFAGPLGWLDTPVPAFIPTAGLVIVGAVLYRRMSHGLSRTLIATGVAGLAFLGIPLVFLQLSGLLVGELIQARYLLPLMVVLVATASLPNNPRREFPWPRIPAVLALGILFLGAISAFWFTAHRYAVGDAYGRFDRNLELMWPGLTSIPLALVTVISIASAGVVFATAYGFFVKSRTVSKG